MSWEADYVRMREVARLAGWTTPERLNPPTEGIKVPTATDKFGAYWTLLTEPLMLERIWDGDVMHIRENGAVSHYKEIKRSDEDALKAAREVKAERRRTGFLYEEPRDA